MYRHLGRYEVVSHWETPECTLRLLKLAKDKSVEPHYHHTTTQIYFVVEGTAHATVGGETMILQPHQILAVPGDAIHGIWTEGEALVLSISVPPLEDSDQYVAT